MNEVAIFWDYENVKVPPKGINVPLAEAILNYSESLGHPRVKRVYSNWGGVNNVIVQALYSLGFDTIHVSMGKTNSVDVKIAVDCLDVAQTYSNIKYFIIITGDKDFISMVNWLKTNYKKVIIIGNSETVSEHLLLSADDFISLEELSKMYKARDFSKTKKPKDKGIHFNTAITWLVETISFAREKGKSTRLALLDNYMRSSQRFNYKGVTSVEKPDKSSTFSSFGKFISAAEKANKIKSEIIEGFTEIFLPEEDPKIESEFSPDLKNTIDRKDWIIIFDLVVKVYQDVFDVDEHKFVFLLKHVRVAKKEGILHYSNKKLLNALSIFAEVGLLIEQSDKMYKLAKDNKERKVDYIDKAIEKMKKA